MLVFGSVYNSDSAPVSLLPRKALAKLFPPAPLAVVNGANGMNGQAVTNGNSPGVGKMGGKTCDATAKTKNNSKNQSNEGQWILSGSIREGEFTSLSLISHRNSLWVSL